MSKKTSKKNSSPTVTVEQLINEHDQELQLHPIGGSHNLKRHIREPTVNRPGLALVGFKKYFASKRVQVF